MQAIEQTLTANSVSQWNEVIELVRGTAKSQLSEKDEALAQKLLATALVRRSEWLYKAAVEAAQNKLARDRQLPSLRINALADLEEVVSLEPGRVEAHELIARFHTLPDGDQDRGREAAAEAVKLLARLPVEQARMLVLRGNFQIDNADKLKDLDEAVRIAPKEAFPYRARGAFYILDNKLDEGLADLKQALELEPRDLAAQEAIARVFVGRGEKEAAIASLTKGIESLPEVPSLYYERSRLLAETGQLEAALADADVVLAKRPNQPLALAWRAELYLRMDQPEKALADSDAVLADAPESTTAASFRAAILQRMKRTAEAIEFLEDFRRRHPNDVTILERLGLIYLADGKFEQSIDALSAAIDLEPQNALAVRTRGDAYISRGRHAEAVADYNRVLELAPRDASTLNNLAWLLCTSPDAEVRDGKRAIELAEKACELTDHKQPSLLSTLAAAYAETGDFEKALMWIDKAKELAGEKNAAQFDKERKSYEDRKPFRETAPASAEERDG